MTFEVLKAMTIKSCYLIRDAVQFGTHLPVFRGKLCPAPSASLTGVVVTDMWQRSKGCEIASGKGTVSYSPARSPGSPPSLYEYLCFSVWIFFYHEKGGNEFLRNANIYLPNYTTSHPPRQYFSTVKKMISKKQAFSMSNRFFVTVKGKGKFHPRTGHEGPEGM